MEIPKQAIKRITPIVVSLWITPEALTTEGLGARSVGSRLISGIA
jgi:hypothetical protein